MSLKITNNVFSDYLLNKLYLYTRENQLQPTRTNFFGWQPEVVGFSNPIFFFKIEGDFKDEIINELFEKQVIPDKTKKMTLNLALYSRYSSIPWHDDSSYSASLTVYLNREWNKNWGGYLVYEENEEIKCYIPKYNSAIYFDCPLKHSVQLTAIDAPMRESLQIFIDKD